MSSITFTSYHISHEAHHIGCTEILGRSLLQDTMFALYPTLLLIVTLPPLPADNYLENLTTSTFPIESENRMAVTVCYYEVTMTKINWSLSWYRGLMKSLRSASRTDWWSSGEAVLDKPASLLTDNQFCFAFNPLGLQPQYHSGFMQCECVHVRLGCSGWIRKMGWL